VEILKIVLPIVWVVVASLVGWFLYRYSTTKLDTKWVVVTGAFLIAAACFYGLYRATPRSFTECVKPGELVVREPDIARLRDRARDLKERVNALRAACTSSPRNDERCDAELDALEEHGVAVAAGLTTLGATR